MTLRLFLILTIVSFSQWSCSNGQAIKGAVDKTIIDTSRIEHFEYGGYSDTIYSLIYGQVFEVEKDLNGKDTLKTLQMVDIRTEQNNKTVQTNSNGEFAIGLEKGVFSFIISRQGYEPIKLTNYVSDPDQVSNTRIILIKGVKLRTFEIPKWVR